MTQQKKKKSTDVFWIKKNFSRRNFLYGSINGAAVALGLPIFDYLLNDSGTAFAQGAPLPTFFGTFFWGLGYGLDANHYLPKGNSGSGNAWQIPTSGHGLSALADLKSYLTVFGNYSISDPVGAGHIPNRGIALSLTQS